MGTTGKQRKTFFLQLLCTLGIAVAFLLCSRSIKIYFINEIPVMQNLYAQASRFVSIGIVLIYFISFKKVQKLPYFMLIGVYALLLVSTLLGEGGNLRRWVSTTYPFMGMCALTLWQCCTLEKAKRFINVLSGLMWILVAINLVLMPFSSMLFGKTDGTDGSLYFLGMENHLIYPLTIGLFFNLLNNHLNQGRTRLQTYVVLFIVTAFLNFSVGGLAGISVLVLYAFLPPVKRQFEKRHFSVWLAVFAVFFIALVFFNGPLLNLPPVRFLLEEVLGKDVTLSNRTLLWKEAIHVISEHPIFGYGLGKEDSVFTILTYWGGVRTWSAHNQYLQTWYNGGPVMLAAIVAFLVYCGHRIHQCKDRKLVGYIQVIAITLMVMLTVEAPTFHTLLFVMLLGATLINVYNKEQSETKRSFVPEKPLEEKPISVVIPVYNVEAFLPACLDSVLNQTYRNLEIIVVNDGATDSSYDICKTYAEKDSRIVLVSQENAGLSAARNTGIGIATADYITFVDSDDVLEPTMIQYLYEMMVLQDADMSVCQKLLVDEQGAPLPDGTVYTDSVVSGNEQCMNAFFFDTSFETCAWGKLYKTSLFETVRYPVGEYHEDVSTTYRVVALCERVAIGSRQLYQYRQRAGSIIKSTFSPKHLDAIKATTERADFVNKRYPKCKTVSKAAIVYAANSCVLRLMRSPSADKETIKFLQKQYRRYEWYFLLGTSGLSAKLFSIPAFICLPAMFLPVKLLRRVKRSAS